MTGIPSLDDGHQELAGAVGSGLDGILDGGGDVPELQRAHRVISAASDRHMPATASQVVQRASRPLVAAQLSDRPLLRRTGIGELSCDALRAIAMLVSG